MLVNFPAISINPVVQPLMSSSSSQSAEESKKTHAIKKLKPGDEESVGNPNNGNVGGRIGTPAFCLLAGRRIGDEGDLNVSYPISRLPAMLGRLQKSTDPHVVEMESTAKALSRQQCRIDYWFHKEGRLEQHPVSGDMEYKDEKCPLSDLDIDEPFYTITCLGKNRIHVNGKKYLQGQTALLRSGDALRISSFWLYFLLPERPSSKTISVELPHVDVHDSPNQKRRNSDVTNSSTPAQSNKRPRGFSSIQAELDSLSNDELKKQFTEAINSGCWERRHQLIGSTLSGRAVWAAAQASKLRSKDALSRGEMMEWIARSDEWKEWSKQMQSKLESKSYQSSITKAMVKAGFTRTATSGRYIKWFFPPQLKEQPKNITGTPTASQKRAAKNDNDEEESHSSNDDVNRDNGMDEDGDDDEEDDLDEPEDDVEKSTIAAESLADNEV